MLRGYHVYTICQYINRLPAPTTCSNWVFAADSPAAGNDPTIAEINGKIVHLSDLERDFPQPLFQARSAYYDSERKVLDQDVHQYLLKQRAEKENLTVDQLIEKHVNSTIGPDPSEEALKVYFEGVDSKESFETLRPQILKVIHERRVAKAKNAYMLSAYRSHGDDAPGRSARAAVLE